MLTTKHLFNTLLLITVPLAGCTVLHGNFRPVQEDALYRSGQLHAQGLQRRLEKHTIQTVVSLRTPDEDESWYWEEKAVCSALDVEHYSIPWSKDSLPTPESLAKLVSLFTTSPKPILVHCQGGVHRSAVASAVFVLLEGGTADQARGQLGRFFNDAAIGRLLDLYEGSTKTFARWVNEDYAGIYGGLQHPDP